MHIILLSTTSGIDIKNGECIEVPKRVVTRLGTIGFRNLDKRYKRLDTVQSIAKEMMIKEKNKIGYAIYQGTISNPRLIYKYITDDYKHLKIDIENG